MPDTNSDALIDDALEEQEPARPESRPASFRLPQIIVEGVLRQSLKGDLITFKLRLLRIIEVTCLIPLPEAGKTRVPVYIRAWVDRSRGDPPGSVVVK